MGGQVAAAGIAGAAAAWMTWAVRGRSSTVFAPSIWRGPADRHEIALTFDDGPSESTPRLLDLLATFGIKATFFQCGMHARRLPAVASATVAAGHEIGNHTENHAPLWLRPVRFLREEIGSAQSSITDTAGVTPTLFRATYGVRWPGLAGVQHEFGLTGVMWTVIGRDWTLPAAAVSRRVMKAARPGAIVCLHDGREQRHNPDVRATLDAVRDIVPRLLDRGYSFRTVGEWVRQANQEI